MISGRVPLFVNKYRYPLNGVPKNASSYTLVCKRNNTIILDTKRASSPWFIAVVANESPCPLAVPIPSLYL